MSSGNEDRISPQKIATFNPHFPATVEEIVALGLLAGKSFPVLGDRRSIDEAMALVDITSIRNKLIEALKEASSSARCS